MKRTTTIFALALLLASAHARTWRNPEGTKSFEADFISLADDKVTVKRAGKEVTFPLDKIHAEDAAWARNEAERIEAKNPPAFENLRFGDDRDTVAAKLRKSEIVETKIEGELTGRTGLNGIFHTKEKIGGHSYALFFGWTTGELLQEIVLRSNPGGDAAYTGSLRQSWTDLVEVLGELYGRPILATGYPERDELSDGMSMNSHLWRIPTGGSVMLGIGQDAGQYVLTATITRKHIKVPR